MYTKAHMHGKTRHMDQHTRLTAQSNKMDDCLGLDGIDILGSQSYAQVSRS